MNFKLVFLAFFIFNVTYFIKSEIGDDVEEVYKSFFKQYDDYNKLFNEFLEKACIKKDDGELVKNINAKDISTLFLFDRNLIDFTIKNVNGLFTACFDKHIKKLKFQFSEWSKDDFLGYR